MELMNERSFLISRNIISTDHESKLFNQVEVAALVNNSYPSVHGPWVPGSGHQNKTKGVDMRDERLIGKQAEPEREC